MVVRETTHYHITMKNINVKQAFDQYIMWIANYPGDFKGATEAASDFIDSAEEVDQLKSLLEKVAQ